MRVFIFTAGRSRRVTTGIGRRGRKPTPINENLFNALGDGYYECKTCGKVLMSRYNIRQHLKRHTGEIQTFDCTQCGKSYTSKQSLISHTLTVHEGKMLRCTYEGCTKQFYTVYSLKQHQRIHEGDFPFKCEICGKGFLRQDHHEDHMNRHYDIRAYECGFCGKKFVRDTELTRHLGTHQEERTVKCTLCDKMFKTTDIMKKHIRKVHEKVKSFLCNICGEVFNVNHMRSHKLHHRIQARERNLAEVTQ